MQSQPEWVRTQPVQELAFQTTELLFPFSGAGSDRLALKTRDEEPTLCRDSQAVCEGSKEVPHSWAQRQALSQHDAPHEPREQETQSPRVLPTPPSERPDLTAAERRVRNAGIR